MAPKQHGPSQKPGEAVSSSSTVESADYFAASMSAAAPIPPPMHIVTTP